MTGSTTPEAPTRRIGAAIDSDRTYFDDVVVDSLLDALVELTAAVWTYRDRALVLERVLEHELGAAGRSVDLATAIERYQPPPEVMAMREKERTALVDAVFASFRRRADCTPPSPTRART